MQKYLLHVTWWETNRYHGFESDLKISQLRKDLKSLTGKIQGYNTALFLDKFEVNNYYTYKILTLEEFFKNACEDKFGV